MTEPARARGLSVALRDVGFAYRSGAGAVLESANVTFDPGALHAVTGASGSGKSTLLYLCALLVTPTSGQVLVDGVDQARSPDRQRARVRATSFGFVFQDAALDPTRSVIDNVVEGALYGGRRSRHDLEARAHQLLEQFGVLDARRSHTNEISGGQAQRAGLCRALIADPAVVLADEPTGNLDAANAGIVIDALRRWAHHLGRTVIVATHDTDIAGFSDHVVEVADRGVTSTTRR